ncbi:MAG: type II secretion system F family protein [Moraxellaceae bacterium]|nr:type II secretion system F family protein [Pseudobdellovibrionaceae bacterium]
MSIFGHEWLVFPLFGLSVFVAVYMWADKIFTLMYAKSVSKRSQVMLHMKLLGLEVNEKKVTRVLLLSSFGVGFLFFFIAYPSVTMGIFLGLSAGIAGFQLVPIIYKSLYEKKCSQFTDQMVDALTIMANGIKSGSNPQQSMQRVVEIMANPIKAEFAQVIAQTQFGDSFEDALTDLGERIPRPDVQMFVTSINILKETGGNMAETFTTIVSTIRERQKLEKKISAMTAQGVTQGVIVTSIPFILGAVFFAVDPAYMKPMFTTTLGLVLLGAMLGLQILGGVMIKKIVTIKV